MYSGRFQGFWKRSYAQSNREPGTRELRVRNALFGHRGSTTASRSGSRRNETGADATTPARYSMSIDQSRTVPLETLPGPSDVPVFVGRPSPTPGEPTPAPRSLAGRGSHTLFPHRVSVGEFRSRSVGIRGRATTTVCSRNKVSDRCCTADGDGSAVDREYADRMPGGTGPLTG